MAGWCNGYGVGLRLEKSRVQLPAVPLSRNDLGQVVHTHVPLSPSSIIWYTSRGAAMSCDWEGNRRSGVALAVRHRLQWFELPTNTLHWGMILFTFLLHILGGLVPLPPQ